MPNAQWCSVELLSGKGQRCQRWKGSVEMPNAQWSPVVSLCGKGYVEFRAKGPTILLTVPCEDQCQGGISAQGSRCPVPTMKDHQCPVSGAQCNVLQYQRSRAGGMAVTGGQYRGKQFMKYESRPGATTASWKYGLCTGSKVETTD